MDVISLVLQKKVVFNIRLYFGYKSLLAESLQSLTGFHRQIHTVQVYNLCSPPIKSLTFGQKNVWPSLWFKVSSHFKG